MLNLTQQDNVGTLAFTQQFSKEIYNNFKWISGCDMLTVCFLFLAFPFIMT